MQEATDVERVSYTYGSVNPSSGYVQPDLKQFPILAILDEGPKFDEDAFDGKSSVQEDHESDVELEGEMVEADNDPPQKMGDPIIEVSEGNHDASQMAKGKAMEVISEGKMDEAIEHLIEAILLNPNSANMYGTRSNSDLDCTMRSTLVDELSDEIEVNKAATGCLSEISGYVSKVDTLSNYENDEDELNNSNGGFIPIAKSDCYSKDGEESYFFMINACGEPVLSSSSSDNCSSCLNEEDSSSSSSSAQNTESSSTSYSEDSSPQSEGQVDTSSKYKTDILELGVLKILIKMARFNLPEEVIKALYAMSALIGNNDYGQELFYLENRKSMLQDIISNSNIDIRLHKKEKALVAIRSLLKLAATNALNFKVFCGLDRIWDPGIPYQVSGQFETGNVHTVNADQGSSGEGASSCFPSIPSQLMGTTDGVSSHYPRPYVVSLLEGSAKAGSESIRKWGRQGLDMNSGSDSKRLKITTVPVPDVPHATNPEVNQSTVFVCVVLAEFFGTGEREMLKYEDLRRVWDTGI